MSGAVKYCIMGIFKKLFGGKDEPETVIEIDEQNFEQQVLAPGTPAVVMFYGKRCQPCHVMNGLLKELAPEYGERLSMFRVDVEYAQELNRQFQVMATPTLIFFKKHRPLYKTSGLLPLNDLREKINGIL